MTGKRENCREHVMASIMEYLWRHPFITAHAISHGTGLPHTEVYRYLRVHKYEFRPVEYLLGLRKTNKDYYIHLLRDCLYVRTPLRDGFFINTSKRQMFERFCFKYGFLLRENNAGVYWLDCILNDYEERSAALGLKKDNTKKSN